MFIGFRVLHFIFQSVFFFLYERSTTSQNVFRVSHNTLPDLDHFHSHAELPLEEEWEETSRFVSLSSVNMALAACPPLPSVVHCESSLVAGASTPFCCFSKNRELFYKQRTMLEAIQSNLYTGLLLFPRLLFVISATLGWCLQGHSSGSEGAVILF